MSRSTRSKSPDSPTEETRLAVEFWVEKSKSVPKVLQRAATVRAEIERDTETRRNAIEAVLGNTAKAEASPARSRSRKVG